MTKLQEYFDALQRIKENRARRVPKGVAINNDNVSIEAGRGRGSIKKSRPAFSGLIRNIAQAEEERRLAAFPTGTPTPTGSEDVDTLRSQLDASLGRELSLLLELYDTKKQLAQLTGGNVLPLRQPK
jgi:hypothetical protein